MNTAILTDLIQILSSNAQTAIQAIQANLASTGTNATSKSSQSLRFTVTQEGSKTRVQLIASKYFTVVETGRKPTPGKKPSRAFVDNIREWQAAKNVAGSPYAIALSINKEGSKLWQKGGRKDIYSDVFVSFTDTIKTEILKEFASDYLIAIKDGFNSN